MLRLDVNMKRPGNCGEVSGKRISPAAYALPAGGFGGTIEKLEIREDVPFGGAGSSCDVNVLASSCKVNK